MFSYAHVWTTRKQLCRHTDAESLRQFIVSPTLALDVLRGDSQQTTKGILHLTDVTLCIYQLSFYVQIRRLHLIDCRRVGLAVFPQRFLSLQRSVPKTVGRCKNLHLTVKHQQENVVLCYRRNQIGTYCLLLSLSLQQHSLRFALLAGDGSKHIQIHAHLQ